MHLMFAARFAWVSVTPLGRDVEPLVNWRNATSSRPTFSGLSGSVDSRMPSMATTCSSAGQADCTVPSRRLIFARGHEDARAALGHDVPGVVEVRLELPEGHRRVDGRGDDAGADRAQKAEDEVVVVREDERDAVALAQAERLERPPEARAHPLDGREGEGRLARFGRVVRAPRGAGGHGEAGDAGLGDEAKAARRLGVGGVFDGLVDGAGRHGLTSG